MHDEDLQHHIAGRLRALRNHRGFTQSALAQQLGITFQQIQKYEKAKDRIAADRLYRMAQILTVEPGEFFEGLPGCSQETTRPERRLMLCATRLGLIPSSTTRQALETLIFSLTDSGKPLTIKEQPDKEN